MAELKDDITAYVSMRGDLEAQHLGKWVVIQNEQLVGIFDTFELAAECAVANFGAGPYLIRQVGAPPVSLPNSIMYNLTNA
jgi:hypothetical protein